MMMNQDQTFLYATKSYDNIFYSLCIQNVCDKVVQIITVG